MRAIILAAGRGKRMREQTHCVPKPLLKVAGHYLIAYAIGLLKRAGIVEIVINIACYGDQIKEALGAGERYGVHIVYSEEAMPLETGGGILKALPLLGREPFVVISGDVITDFPLTHFLQHTQHLAHLLMVENPSYHLTGDFGLEEGVIKLVGATRYTYANISLIHPDLFLGRQAGIFPLREVLIPAISAGSVTGEIYRGLWHNVGTPEDLAYVNICAREDSNLRPLVSETNTLSN